MKFKIGDQVTVISIGAGNGWAEPMDKYLHKTGTIIADYRADPALEFDYLPKNIKRYQVDFPLPKFPDLWWFPEDSLELVTQNRHKHADLIHAWAEGAQIEIKLGSEWVNDSNPDWYLEYEYRIKPTEPNWWENIPEHGILVKEINDHKNMMIWWRNYSNHEEWTPLTNEEIEVFKR